MERPEAQPAGPPPWVRKTVSLAIALHFFAILTTVVGSGTHLFPPPMLAEMVRLWKPINVYLHSIFLTNPYRFYAPDPGPTNIMWFRLRYADGAVRWVELSRRDEWAMRIPYQRHMSLTMLLNGLTMPDPVDSRKVVISEEGQVCIASFVRHLARTYPRFGADGTTIAVDWITAYNVFHGILEPGNIRMNWEFDDPRMYEQVYLGVYRQDGIRNPDGYGPYFGYRIQYGVFLFAQSLLQDVAPLVQNVPREKRLQAIEPLDLPIPWRKLLVRFPELLDDLQPLSVEEDATAQQDRIVALQTRIQDKIASQDKPLPEDPMGLPNKR